VNGHAGSDGWRLANRVDLEVGAAWGCGHSKVFMGLTDCTPHPEPLERESPAQS